MEIIFVTPKNTTENIIAKVNNRTLDRILRAFNVVDAQSYILPVVPVENPFKKIADISNYKGLSTSFNLPGEVNLDEFSWSSIFPVYKDYPFQRKTSNANGWDYVKLLEEKQQEKKPMRLIVVDKNNLLATASGLVGSDLSASNGIKSTTNIIFDGLVLVKSFEYKVDSAKDISYSLCLSKFNSDIANFSLDWSELTAKSAINVTTKYALKSAGLI